MNDSTYFIEWDIMISGSFFIWIFWMVYILIHNFVLIGETWNKGSTGPCCVLHNSGILGK